MTPVPPHTMRDLSRLNQRHFDVLIIGGGINGAGLARDLALRGLAVALVEQGDFASGTSSASTKLVHGGLRYLERFDLRLVFEACRERRVLQTIAPHLVQPLPFFIPVYRGDPRPLWLVRAGMLFYDTLAMFRNTHTHAILSPAAALALEPVLDGRGLRGVARYWDCRMDDARLCLENVVAAAAAGAETVNYCRATALLQHNGRVSGARVEDQVSGAELEVEAHVVVNAAGPWLDAVCALAGEEPGKLRLTRGTHILVPRINCGEEALYLTAGRDQRLFFVIPWGRLSLVGTTDVDFADKPEQVAPVEEDIAYLIAESGRHLREHAPQRRDVIAAFAGLRPLVAENAGQTSRVSREHHIFHADNGLISIAGGKYTTYRAVAAEVAALVSDCLGRGRGDSRTANLPLPGGAVDDWPVFAATTRTRFCVDYGIPAELAARLVARYGARCTALMAVLDSNAALALPVVPGSPLLHAEVLFAARYDFARTPDDILRRRTDLALGPGRGLNELGVVAALLQQELGVTEATRQRWEDDYRARHIHY